MLSTNTFFWALPFGLVFLKLFRLQRRNTLEEWMQKLLSDIDLARSAPVAAFLELEAAARSCMRIDP
jgi:hypothetical protein